MNAAAVTETNPSASTQTLADALAQIEQLARTSAAAAMTAADRYLVARAATLLPDPEMRRGMRAALISETVESTPILLWPDENRELFEADAGGWLRGSAGICQCSEASRLFLVWGLATLRGRQQPQPLVCLLNPGTNSRLTLKPVRPLGFDRLPWARVSFERQLHAERGADADSDVVCFADLTGYRAFDRRLRRERLIVWSALALALARASFDYALDYSRRRTTFGKAINQHQAIALKLADMAIALDAWQATLRRSVESSTAAGPDQDQGQEQEAQAWAMWKGIRAAAGDVATKAVRILGGHGFLTLHPVEGWLRDIQFLRAALPEPEHA